jgi:MoaA/NifB/PqqE/SkfB family radical SAM enzyme
MNKLILDGHKLMWHRERLEALLNGERIAPITIDCALTRRCTYRCVYCYGRLQANDEKKMTKDVIYRFLDDAAEIGVKAISFVSDGESTCSPHLYDAIIRGRENGLDMALGTNGYLLEGDRLEKVLPMLTYIRYNISAANSKRYAEIHGCGTKCYERVIKNIKDSVRIKREMCLNVTIGLQMVLLPEFEDQILPLAALGRKLGVDYFVIKHCSDDENGALGIDYNKYDAMVDIIKEAESYSTCDYLVKAKWSKILSGGKRRYDRCYGPPLIAQFSGSGLVAPCGMLFNSRYKDFHIGNIAEKSFKEIWQSDRYWEVMAMIASDRFNPQYHCGTLCLQHKVNEFLWDLRQDQAEFPDINDLTPPNHINFI